MDGCYADSLCVTRSDATRARASLKGNGEETEEIDNLLTKQHEVVHTFGWYIRKYITEARAANMPLGKRVLRADDFLPEKDWHVLAAAGYICDDPYTGAPGVTRLSDDRWQVSTRVALEDCAMLGDRVQLSRPPWPAMHVQSRNSVALRLALVADGSADATVSLSAKRVSVD